MDIHKNARTAPQSRALMVHRFTGVDRPAAGSSGHVDTLERIRLKSNSGVHDAVV